MWSFLVLPMIRGYKLEGLSWYKILPRYLPLWRWRQKDKSQVRRRVNLNQILLGWLYNSMSLKLSPKFLVTRARKNFGILLKNSMVPRHVLASLCTRVSFNVFEREGQRWRNICAEWKNLQITFKWQAAHSLTMTLLPRPLWALTRIWAHCCSVGR